MTLPEKLAFAIVLAQVALTLGLYLRLGVVRTPLYDDGKVDRKAVALDTSAWPEASRKISSSVANQFELPVLFYAASILALAMGAVTWPLLVFMAAFVVFRYIHAFEHIGRNDMRRRFFWFRNSYFANLLIWIWLAAVLLVMR